MTKEEFNKLLIIVERLSLTQFELSKEVMLLSKSLLELTEKCSHNFQVINKERNK